MEMSIVVNNNNEKVVKKKVLGGNFNMDFYNEIEKINESTTNFLEKLVKNEYKNNEKLLEKLFYENSYNIFLHNKSLKIIDFTNVLKLKAEYFSKNIDKYKYLFFFLYLINSSNRRIVNNIIDNLPTFFKSVFSYFDLDKVNKKIIFIKDEKKIKEILKHKIDLWVDKKELGTYDESFVVRSGKRRITRNISDDMLKEINRLNKEPYTDFSNLKNPYIQKGFYLFNLIVINNLFNHFEIFNEAVRESLINDNIIERTTVKRGIISRYEEDFKNKDITEKTYKILKKIEKEFSKLGLLDEIV